MKFAPIIFHRSFRSHCPTVWPNSRDNLSGNRKLPPIVGPKSDMADYRRLLFPPTQVLPLPDFSSDFPSDPTILRSVGQWDAGFMRNFSLQRFLKKVNIVNYRPWAFCLGFSLRRFKIWTHIRTCNKTRIPSPMHKTWHPITLHINKAGQLLCLTSIPYSHRMTQLPL